MNRLFIVLAFVSLAGCRMCGSPYDYCIPAYTQRADDYRGCDVFYRAGSIFRSSDSRCDGTDIDFIADRSMNSGNFGTTTPVDVKRPTPRTLEPRKMDRPAIGIPPKSATPNGIPFDQQIPILPDLPSPSPTVPPGFSPLPVDQNRTQSGPTITVEELRRLDPTVTDIRILNVEDAPNPKTGLQVP